jgi:5'-nucleotidase
MIFDKTRLPGWGGIPEKPKEVWIQTYTGKKFSPISPRIEDICIEDISHALSMLCRFTGHCSEFYSVAQHCVAVSYLCSEANRFYGLMHDASEYALNDVSSPLKRSGYFEDYRRIEKNLQTLICRKFGLAEEEPLEVKVADLTMLATEARDLLPGGPHPDFRLEYVPLPTVIIPLSPRDAERQFLARYRELTGV